MNDLMNGHELPEGWKTEQSVRCDIVADFGNSLVAGIVSVDNKTILVPPFPALVGLRGASLSRLLRDRGETVARRGEYSVTLNGVESFVGALAMEAREVSHARGSEDRYTDTWNIRFLAALVGAALPGPTDKDGKLLPMRVTGKLTTMIPAELWAERHQAVKAMFEGLHKFVFNGREFVLDITRCTVERETFAAWNLLTDTDKKETTLILDIGGGTAQAAVIRDGKILKAITRNQGIETILDDLPHTLAPWEREALKDHLRENNKRDVKARLPFTIVRAGKDIRIDEDAQRMIDQAAKDFLSQVKSAIPRDKRDSIKNNRIVGGGVHTSFGSYAEIIKDRETGKTRLERIKGCEPELANLFGAAKAAGFDPAKSVKAR